MIDLLTAMGIVAIGWLLSGAVLIGVGLGIRRGFGIRELTTTGLMDAFWLGLAAVIALLQLWHLALPISSATAAIVAVVGIVGLIAARDPLLSYCRGLPRSTLWWAMPSLLFALWLANLATGPLAAYDTGLYHLPAVEWIRQFPIVPGLGNLHARLAYNNSNLLYAAIFEFGPWEGHCSSLAYGPLIIMAFVQGIRAARRLLTPRACPSDDVIGGIVLLPLTLFVVGRLDWFPGLYTDLLIGLLFILAGGKVLVLIRKRRPGGREDVFSMVWIGAMLATAICFKLSAVVPAGLILALVLVVWIVKSDRAAGGKIGGVAGAVLAAGILVLPWCGRGIVLSGYPAFPSTLLAVDCDWRVPPECARSERLWMQSWARQPEVPIAETRGWSWFGPWVERALAAGRYLLLIPLALSVAGMTTATWRRRSSPGTDLGWLLLIPLAAALAVWFWTAPLLRYGACLFWFAASLGVSMGHNAFGTAERRLGRVMLVIFVLLCVPPLVRSKPLSVGGDDHGLSPAPVAEMRSFVTDSGLRIYTPVTGNQAWYAPIPNTPHPDRALRLRGRDLGSGFTRQPMGEEDSDN